MGGFADDFIYGPIELIAGFIWGGSWGDTQILPVYASPMVVVLLGSGLYLMVALKARPLRRLFPAFAELWSGRKGQGDGEITPWQALSTALSGQVGTGNLAGVATALTLGGPGAIFWMWVTAFFGMALAFAESSLAVRFREKTADGHFHGGPMYYIKHGLGPKWRWLAIFFCIGTLISAVATGGMIQSNSITQSVVETGDTIGLSIPTWSVGAVIALLVFAVIIGGIKSIGSVAGKVVPFMALTYIIIALVVVILNVDQVDDAFGQIFAYAFGLEAVVGGAVGYGLVAAIRFGVARGLFSNEAGQGSAPIAHAAAQTNDPVKQGEIASIGVFLDTIVICTMTALAVLVVTGDLESDDPDFERSPARVAYVVCDQSDLVDFNDFLRDDEGLSDIGDLFLGASDARGPMSAQDLAALSPRRLAEEEEDAAKRPDNGARAAEILMACRDAGVPFLTFAREQQVRAAENPMEDAALEALYAASWAEVIPFVGDGYITEDELEAVDRAWKSDLESAAVTTAAYASAIPYGNWVVTIAIALFAFTTMIGWSYYAETAITYLLGDWAARPFRFAWVGVVFVGALQEVSAVWKLGDFANASMAFPNIIAVVLLSGTVLAMVRAKDGKSSKAYDPYTEAGSTGGDSGDDKGGGSSPGSPSG